MTKPRTKPSRHDPKRQVVRTTHGVRVSLSGAELIEKALSTPSTQDPKNVPASDRAEPEDDTAAFKRAIAGIELSLLTPAFDPALLSNLLYHNNTLGPCIEAAEVNMDGTGFTIEAADENLVEKDKETLDAENEVVETEKPPKPSPEFKPSFAPPKKPKVTTAKDKALEAEKRRLTAFFTEPYPGESFTTIRRKVRRDRETTGNGYMEMIRDAEGKLVYVRHLDAVRMRLVKLDGPVAVQRTIVRDGKDVTATVMMRERRFCQIVGTTKVFFSEFGASRKLDKTTGLWQKDFEEKFKDDKERVFQPANEVLWLPLKRGGPSAPYGDVRWMGQLPSILGSRKAEEFNLEYLDSGGIPPMLILVSGGTMASEAVDELRNHLTSRGKARVQAIVMEAFASEGSLDRAGQVDIKVERFGTERQKDSLFEMYDKRCEERVRKAYRLPPLFLGMAEDYTFASVFASYLVAEAQVFAPERIEFDEIVNTTIMRDLEAKGVVFRSKPLTVHDIADKLKAIEMANAASAIGPEELIEQLNEATGLDMEFDEDANQQGQLDLLMGRMDVMDKERTLFNKPNPETGAFPPMKRPRPPTQKGEGLGLAALAAKTAALLHAGISTRENFDELRRIGHLVQGLHGVEQQVFKALVAVHAYGDVSADPDGAAELAACAWATLTSI